MLSGVKEVMEVGAHHACLRHLLLRGVHAGAISSAMDELAGAQREGKRTVTSQERNVGMGVANCLQGWALKEEVLTRVLSL